MGITAMTLNAMIKLDDSEFKSKLSGAEDKCKGFGDKLKKVGSGITKVGKVAGVAIGAAAVAVGKLAMDSVNAYANYEQLVGGVETLFGRSSKAVIENAHKAFKTVGVDANTYMETVTSFSASLLQSVGGDTKKAAEIADMAMVDMADNANKMGTDMSAIQNAYQGFAKQNYTMLDNLKLGYGGTKSEMQRLLKDAQRIQKENGKNVKYNIKNLSDIYEAIHVVQTELGITGTTAKEADTTIQGSFNRMRASWENLKIAFVDPDANIGDALADMIESGKVALKNFAPAFKNALKGIGSAIAEVAPIISAELPGLITDILPDLITAAVSICSALATAVVENGAVIIDGIGQVFQAAGEAMKNSESPVFQAIGSALDFIGDLIRDPSGTLAQAWEDLNTLVEEAWAGIADWFNDTVWQPIVDFFTPMWDTLTQLWDGTMEAISGAWSTIADWFNTTVWTPLSEFFSPVWESITQLWEGVKASISGAWAGIANWFNKTVWEPLKEFFDPIWEVISGLWGDISGSIESAWSAVEGILKPIIEPIQALFQGVVDVVSGIWNTLSSIFGLGDKTINVTVNKKVTGTWGDDAGNLVTEFEDGSNITDFSDTTGGTGAGKGGFAKGSWNIPHDMFAQLHRNEMVLTASQARRYREGDRGIDLNAMTRAIVGAVRHGMEGVSVNSYLNGIALTDAINMRTANELKGRRFST